jgi:hypothetical protein
MECLLNGAGGYVVMWLSLAGAIHFPVLARIFHLAARNTDKALVRFLNLV